MSIYVYIITFALKKARAWVSANPTPCLSEEGVALRLKRHVIPDHSEVCGMYHLSLVQGDDAGKTKTQIPAVGTIVQQVVVHLEHFTIDIGSFQIPLRLAYSQTFATCMLGGQVPF